MVYNSAGVAGARYSDFNRTKLFFDQISLLGADLLIISLGTNESFDPKYDPYKFEKEVDSMLSRLRRVSPGVNILLTLPSENYRVKSGIPQANEVVGSVSQMLRNQAYKHNCAIWDLYAAMGGKGSMLQWHKEGLVNKDHIHYLRKGYNKQGVLLYEAIQTFLVTN
jgi:lysophospholipase L1-like esterase